MIIEDVIEAGEGDTVVADKATPPVKDAPLDKGKADDGKGARDASGRFANKDAGDKAVPPAKDKGTIASGADPLKPLVPADFPDDWKEKTVRRALAQQQGLADPGRVSAKDVAKALKRIENHASPSDLFLKAESLEAKFSGGKFVEIPGKDADEETVAAYNKARGVPDKPDGYFDKLALSGNRTLGESDRKTFDFYAARAHEAGIAPEHMSVFTNAFLDVRQAEVEAQDEMDTEFRGKGETDLRREWGPQGFTANSAIIKQFMDDQPEAIKSFFERARVDGHLVGDDPQTIKSILKWAKDLNYDGGGVSRESTGGTSAADRLEQIREMHRSSPDKITPAIEAEQIRLIGDQQSRSKRGKQA